MQESDLRLAPTALGVGGAARRQRYGHRRCVRLRAIRAGRTAAEHTAAPSAMLRARDESYAGAQRPDIRTEHAARADVRSSIAYVRVRGCADGAGPRKCDAKLDLVRPRSQDPLAAAAAPCGRKRTTSESRVARFRHWHLHVSLSLAAPAATAPVLKRPTARLAADPIVTADRRDAGGSRHRRGLGGLSDGVWPGEAWMDGHAVRATARPAAGSVRGGSAAVDQSGAVGAGYCRDPVGRSGAGRADPARGHPDARADDPLGRGPTELAGVQRGRSGT